MPAIGYCARMAARVLVITGSMGSGKTTALGEASDLLVARGVAHLAVDLDAIATAGLPTDVAREVRFRSLAAIAAAVADTGIRRALLAVAVEHREDLERIREAMSASKLSVCRLTAKIETMEDRVRLREPGMCQAQFVVRVRELECALESARVEDCVVLNDGRSITDVALEMLDRAGWLSDGDDS